MRRIAPLRRMLSAFAGLMMTSIGLGAAGALAQDLPVVPYRIESGGISAPLGGRQGDAGRGRKLVTDRRKGLCLLCHSGPFPEERFQGDLAPSLAGIASRLTAEKIRLRIVDSTAINPASLMPPYHRIEGLVEVGAAWRGKPILTAEEIEDVVAFLGTLRD